jgi:hypothetical protein
MSTDSIVLEKDEREFMLTTKDNPFNPWTDYDDWYAFDRDKGYHSPSYQARIAFTSDDLSDEENDQIINQAIEDIIRLDKYIGVGYTKAYKP